MGPLFGGGGGGAGASAFLLQEMIVVITDSRMISFLMLLNVLANITICEYAGFPYGRQYIKCYEKIPDHSKVTDDC
jgi:hypothetical protein